MASYTKKTNSNGTPVYRNVTDNVPVKAGNIPELVLAKLEVVPEGTVVPENDQIDDTVPNAPTPDKSVKTVKIHLDNTLCVNGVAYRGGVELDEDDNEVDVEIEVPEEMVKDLKRMDRAYKKYEGDLHRGQDFSRKAAGLDAELVHGNRD